MKNTIRLMMLVILLSITSHASRVYADGFYIGAGVYQAYAEEGIFDDSDTVPALFAGYNFIDTNIFMASAEMGYYDLGGYNGTEQGIKYDIDASAFTLAAVGYLPIGPFFEIYAKAGVAAVSVDLDINGSKSDADGTEAFGGIGAAFDILDTIDIYAEYLVFDTDVDSSMAGVGVRLDF
ncbi:outer membrane beta-barrel protein [Alkalimarinus sediminis]|uniref:Outer membrane beta-barrel protein n=1 Tax=Alkalimarinus sediminis TaxID=1632866 RepID=A0A9E8KNK0_9ALTE|nr:outer membrane beta-barrel protein [Alkalimarinus sediminis]UZW74423.1 outer membrane beta-barrel protein [Alkalimarinus sediminis]